MIDEKIEHAAQIYHDYIDHLLTKTSYAEILLIPNTPEKEEKLKLEQQKLDKIIDRIETLCKK